MKTYIINLESAHDRRESMESQAKRLGLDYELIPAINGNAIPVNMLSLLKRDHSYAVTPGEIGCSLSHLTTYKALDASNDDCALVVEDDIFLPEDISIFLTEVENSIPKNIPYVYLLSKVNHYNSKSILDLSNGRSVHDVPGEIFHNSLIIGPAAKVNHYNSKSILDLSNGRSVHDVYNAAFSHAYIINKPAARILLDKLFPIWCVADQWQTFKEFGFIHLRGIIPEYINTNPAHESVTTIGNRNDSLIQQEKNEAWKAIYSGRSFKIKLTKALNLLFHRPFQKIIKQ
ncbi:glycosyltransferase family 25 protein [Enterobacter hormaechei]|uniref:glycosyltransferase family 25 protein n=2 Tax=Gammaproteobacteria TaxID=1236 RepID=UPI003CF10D4B